MIRLKKTRRNHAGRRQSAAGTVCTRRCCRSPDLPWKDPPPCDAGLMLRRRLAVALEAIHSRAHPNVRFPGRSRCAIREVMAHRVCPWWLGYLSVNPLRRLVQAPLALLRPYVK